MGKKQPIRPFCLLPPSRATKQRKRNRMRPHLRQARHLGLRRLLPRLAIVADDLRRHVALGGLGGGLALAAEPLGLARRHFGEEHAGREGGEKDHGDQNHAAQGGLLVCRPRFRSLEGVARGDEGKKTKGEKRGREECVCKTPSTMYGLGQTYNPSSTMKDGSSCMIGLPQPPAISAILVTPMLASQVRILVLGRRRGRRQAYR